jgi:hypothetical protein
MRALILVAAVLALAACRNNDGAGSTQNVDENLTAENIVSNDVTAVDAVTGDSANMAADAQINDIGAQNVLTEGNMSSPTKPTPKRPRPAETPTEPTTANTTAPASNVAGNATE